MIKEKLYKIYAELGYNDKMYQSELFDRKFTVVENEILISLDLSQMQLDILPEEYFQDEELFKNVKYLGLGYNSLDKLHENFFDYFPNLEKLELYANNLTSLPELKLPKLKFLDISSNKLELSQNIFQYLNELEFLDIGGNELTKLNPDVFSGLNSLKTLNLSENQIETLDNKVFSYLPTLEELFLLAS